MGVGCGRRPHAHFAMRRVTATAVFLMVMLTSVAASGNPKSGKQQPLTFTTVTATSSWGSFVEQLNDWPAPQDPIVNPLPACTWDINDHLSLVTTDGYIDPGVTVAKSVCMVADFDPVYKTVNGTANWWQSGRAHYGLSVTAPSPDLTVAACYEPQGRCFNRLPTYDPSTRMYGWSLCSQVVYAPDDEALAEVPGSNGGYGVVETITATISNTTDRRVKDIVAGVGVTSAAGLANPPRTPGCPDPLPPKTFDYPFSWVT